MNIATHVAYYHVNKFLQKSKWKDIIIQVKRDFEQLSRLFSHRSGPSGIISPWKPAVWCLCCVIPCICGSSKRPLCVRQAGITAAGTAVHACKASPGSIHQTAGKQDWIGIRSLHFLPREMNSIHPRRLLLFIKNYRWNFAAGTLLDPPPSQQVHTV